MCALKIQAIILTMMVTLLLGSTAALAQTSTPPAPGPLILTDNQGENPLGLYLEILEDPGGELTIDEVSSPEFAAKFIPSQVEVPNYGLSDSAYWVRFRLDNQARQIDEWLLEVGFANMHYVDLYTPLPGGNGFEVRRTGALRPASTLDIFYPRIIFDLAVPIQSQQDFYLRFKNGGSMTLPLTLWTKDAFWVQAQAEQMQDWLFFGALSALLVYHLFLLFSLKDASYLFFVILLASLLLEELVYRGYFGVYIFQSLFAIKPQLHAISFSLFIASILAFSTTFLELKTRSPNLYWVNLVFVVPWIIITLLAPFVSYHILVIVGSPWAVLSLILVLVTGIVSWRSGFRPAVFFMLAWIGMLVSLIIVILVRRDLVPSTSLTENLYSPGLIWMAVCWSIALADRINQLKADTENANRKLLNSEFRLSQILEGIPLGLVVYGKDFKPNYANKRTSEILSNSDQGIQPDLSAGRTLAQAIQYYSLRLAGIDQDYPLENFPIISALKGEPSSRDDIEMEQGDRRIALEIWANPIKDDAGNVESAVMVFQDITQRKLAEAELAEFRKNLELLVDNRTAELNAANKELSLRLEWLSAIVQVTEIIARSSDYSQIYEKIIQIIKKLFAVEDTFIAELDEKKNQLKILAHTCRSDLHSDLIGSLTTLPESILPFIGLEQTPSVFISANQLASMSGVIGLHIQVSLIRGIALVPLHLHEKTLGFLGLEMQEEGRTIKKEESNLISVFSTDIAQLIESSRLFKHTRELVAVEERNRVARDLHDSVTQILFAASVLAEATPRIWNKDQSIAQQNLIKLSLLIRGALAEMRSMLVELRSEEFHNQTLDQLIITLVEAARVRTHAAINILRMDIPDLPRNVTLAMYRIAQEAMNNALIHAEPSQIKISLLADATQAELHIQDDGGGFDPAAVTAEHLGIRIMGERAAEVGGDVQVHSEPGQGTDIIITWPGQAGGTQENG